MGKGEGRTEKKRGKGRAVCEQIDTYGVILWGTWIHIEHVQQFRIIW